jgi:tripartite-type tricarboxylate transporter receptor subunit TctC
MMKKALLVISASTLALLGAPLHAQSWPSQSINLIVPSAPGGPTDLIARLVGEPLAKALGQQVVVSNKPGASGNIGIEFVRRAPADGHTLLVQYSGYHVGNPALYPTLNWNPTRDFTGVAMLMRAPHVIATSPSLPAHTLKELIEYGRKSGKGITYASSGSGSIQHIAGEMFHQATGVKVTHVPYKGAGPAVTDMIGGFVDIFIAAPTSVISHEKTGKVKILAYTSAKRHPSMPHVPTSAEAGLPGYEVEAWFALFAPAGTPKPVVERLTSEIRKIVETEAFRKRVEEQGAFTWYMDPAALNSFVPKELDFWRETIQRNGIKPD